MFPADKTQQKPQVTIPANHYVVMYDPDAVNHDWIHWISSSSEEDVLPYQGPTPPPNSGIHHYIFVLSAGKLPGKPAERGGQKAIDFIHTPIASTFFTVQAPL
jgi:phosphatidylethanolamine-binding protein (PEBP) family uncharacterized protein